MAADLSQQIERELNQLRTRVGGVHGALLASTDGFAWARDLDPGLEEEATALAAMVASMLGLGKSMVGLVGGHHLDETTVRSDAGCVCIYAVGPDAVLTLLVGNSVKLARAHVEARRTAVTLAAMIA